MTVICNKTCIVLHTCTYIFCHEALLFLDWYLVN